MIEKVQLLSDASAAIGIASRRGSGKVRHIEVNQLWLQDKILSGNMELSKVSTGNNVADALTKHVEAEILVKHMRSVGMHIEEGRHMLIPEVAEQAQGRE